MLRLIRFLLMGAWDMPVSVPQCEHSYELIGSFKSIAPSFGQRDYMVYTSRCKKCGKLQKVTTV